MADQACPALSVVSPVYQAQDIVDELVQRLIEELDAMGLEYEIILVDDRSPDSSWERIVDCCAKHDCVRGIRLSRNFGQHSAIAAGLAASTGDHVVVMDCDLQDNPKYLADLYAAAQEGHDIVYTRSHERQHSFFRNLTARLYFAVLGSMTNGSASSAHLSTSAYSLLSRRVVGEYLRILDPHSHYLLNLRQLGFSTTVVEVEHDARYAGESSYTFGNLIRHAANGITSSSARLLNVSIGLGLSLFVLSMLGAAYLVVGYFVRGALAGYTSLMVIMLLATGMILISVGVAGLYIGRIFEQVKDRPLYIVDDTVNGSED